MSTGADSIPGRKSPKIILVKSLFTVQTCIIFLFCPNKLQHLMKLMMLNSTKYLVLSVGKLDTLQNITNRLELTGKVYGKEINIDKSKVMRTELTTKQYKPYVRLKYLRSL